MALSDVVEQDAVGLELRDRKEQVRLARMGSNGTTGSCC